MADPIYNFTQSKPSLADDVDPTQVAPPADRLFPIPVFQANGDRVACLRMKAAFSNNVHVATPGSYNVQLFLNTGALGAYVAYGGVIAGSVQNQTVSLPFGDIDTADVLGFFRVTGIVSPAGVAMSFVCSLEEAPPVLYNADGTPVVPSPTGGATAANQVLEIAELTTIAGNTAAPSAVSLIRNVGADVTKNIAVGSTVPTGIYAKNRDASTRYLQFFNTITFPGAGATPAMSFELPSGAIMYIDEQLIGPRNTQFPLGMAFGWSSVEATFDATGVVAANQTVQVWGHPA